MRFSPQRVHLAGWVSGLYLPYLRELFIYNIIKEETGGVGINEQNESKFMAPMP